MLLQQIKLRNVLSFGPSGLDLELAPLNVLIGPNGSGKSNLIEAIGLIQAVPESLHNPIRDGGGVRKWIWRGEQSHTFAELEVVVPYTERTSLSYQLCFNEVDQRFQIHSESLRDDATEQNPDPIPYFDRALGTVDLPSGVSKLKQVHVKNDRSVLSQVKGPDYPELTYTSNRFQDIHLYRHWEFGRQALLRHPQSADLPNDVLAEDNLNLALVLNRLKRDHPVASDRLLNELRQLYDGIEAIDVSVEGNTVQLFLREGQVVVPSTRLSDGTLRYICLLAVLCHPRRSSLICIEEPELGLHPDLLPGIADLMLEASERLQLVVTTHSDVLVDRLTDVPDSVIVCEKPDGETQLRRLDANDLKHWLEKNSLGELWTNGELGGNRW